MRFLFIAVVLGALAVAAHPSTAPPDCPQHTTLSYADAALVTPALHVIVIDPALPEPPVETIYASLAVRDLALRLDVPVPRAQAPWADDYFYRAAAHTMRRSQTDDARRAARQPIFIVD